MASTFATLAALYEELCASSLHVSVAGAYFEYGAEAFTDPMEELIQMGKITASNVSLFIEDAAGASRSIAGQGNSITLSFSNDQPEVTTFGSLYRERLPGGLRDFELSFEGFYDNASGGIGQIFFELFNAGGATLIQLGPSGSSASAQKFVASAVMTGFEIPFSLEDAVGISATFTARAGSMTFTAW